ncbi:hypothetical protein SAMN04487838_1228 [Streptococcus equinus]|uniref:hypothetical protein n=1 Tax=Streptococcus equinus TaxID=1335 RepID=UPI0008C6CA10|nr:hypothetical protein [Streptococcus equinus]SEK56725.1 hypothetical protein SAMN04487838_1228 [Streptococcus equinus]
MSKEIQEYILSHYRTFSTADIKKAGSSYLDICDTVNEMEKAGLVEWEEEQRKYVVLVETPPQTGMMSKEIQEYILKNYRYRSFSLTDITKETDKYYNEVCETVKQMEKAGVVEWKKEQGKYVVIAEPSTDYISQTAKEKDYTPQTVIRNKKNSFNLNNYSEFTSQAERFKEAKKNIDKFAKSVPKKSALPMLAEKKEGLFFTHDAKVKAEDVNKITESVQKSLKANNNHIIKIYKEFTSIYNAFDSLDKDYMQRILLNTEAAKEANKKAVRGLEENQKLIESQKMVIEVLKKHKDDLDELQHLKDIDWFYDEYQDFKASQEDAFDEVYTSQELVADEILHLQDKQTTTTQQLTNLDDEYQDFKASQEKAFGELHTSQESMAGQFSAFQEEYNKISQVQTESLAETKRLQEEAGKKIQYLSIGLGVNFVAVVVLLILLVSGVF